MMASVLPWDTLTSIKAQRHRFVSEIEVSLPSRSNLPIETFVLPQSHATARLFGENFINDAEKVSEIQRLA